MLKQRCSADMSNPNEEIVPKRIGKFVTFSQECDNPKKDLENAIVFPKTKAPEKVVQVDIEKYSWSPEYPEAEEVIDLPCLQPGLLERETTKSNNKNCMIFFSRKIADDFPKNSSRKSNCEKMSKNLSCVSSQLNPRKERTTQMNAIYKKLKLIHQRKQMDDLITLCKEKMSISTKETEKMDEDSNT